MSQLSNGENDLPFRSEDEHKEILKSVEVPKKNDCVNSGSTHWTQSNEVSLSIRLGRRKLDDAKCW